MQPFWMLTGTERYAGSLAANYSTLIFMSYFKCKITSDFTDDECNTGSIVVKYVVQYGILITPF